MKRYIFYIVFIAIFTGCSTSSDISDSNTTDSVNTGKNSENSGENISDTDKDSEESNKNVSDSNTTDSVDTYKDSENSGENISDTVDTEKDSEESDKNISLTQIYYPLTTNRVKTAIRTESGEVIEVTENRVFPILERENKKISITLPGNLVLANSRTLQNINRTNRRSLKSSATQTISTVKLSIFYPDNSAYLENLDFQENNGSWEVELIDFPVIANYYRFRVSILDDTNRTIMSGEISQNLTEETSDIQIPISFVEPKEILLSLLTDIITTVADGNISLKFQISNPSNDTNLTYQITSDTNISNFLNSDGTSGIDGNLSSAEYSELDLVIPNVFEKNVSYKYRFILISGDGNKVIQNFEIFIPYLRASPKITLLFPTETKNIFITLNETNITLEAVFDNSSKVVDTNWSLLNSSFQFENNTSNPATIIGFDGNISDTVILKILDIEGLISIENYVINLNDSVAPEIPTVVYPATTNSATPNITISGEPKAKIVIDGTVSSQTILNSGTFELSISLANEGKNNISIALEDASGNRGDEINITIFRDTTPPATNSEVTFFETDSISPNLIGTLPTSADDNLSKYSVTILIDGNSYETENNGTHWKIASSTITDLEEGYYDLNITTSDELNNSSTTDIPNAFRVKYSAFLTTPKIEGLYYISGSKNGTTNISGMFKYETGGTLSLYLGNETSGIALGTIALSYLEDENLSFLKLLNGSDTESSQKSLNVIRLLASLDADKDLSNGILIDSQTSEAFVLANPDFNLEMNSSDFSEITDISDIFNDLAPHFGEHRGLISDEDGDAIVAGLISGEIVNATYSTDEESTISILSGTLQTVEGAVEGMAFRSGAQSGFTDENGTFYYEDGKKIRFSIGMMEFSETLAKSTMSPFDMVESVSFDHPKPRNISTMLTMFDAILGDTKVTIDKAVIDMVNMYRSPVDLNLPDGAANEEMNISAGENEFLAQFNQFEICAEMMEDINTSRNENGVQRVLNSLNRGLFSVSSSSMEDLKALQVSANPGKQVADIFVDVKDFHLFRGLFEWNKLDTATLLINGQNGIPIFSARAEKDPHHTDYPINYNKPITRYMPVLPPESVTDQYTAEQLGDKETAVYNAPMVSAGTIGKGRILAMSGYTYGSILVNPRNYSANGRNKDTVNQPDTADMENFFHNTFKWLSQGKYSKDGTAIDLATNKEFAIFTSVGGWSWTADRVNFNIHNNFNINQNQVTDFENLNPTDYPILILEEFARHKIDSIQKSYLDKLTDLPHLLKYVQNGGSILIMESFYYPENSPKTVNETLLAKAGLYVIRNQRNGATFLPKHNKVGGVHQFDMCVQDYVGLTQLERKVGLTTYENLATTKDGLIAQIKNHLGESSWESGLDETLKMRERTIYKLGTEDNKTFTESDCLVIVEDSNGTNTTVQSQLVKGDGIPGDADTWYKYDSYVKYPVDLNFIEAQGDMGGKMNSLLAHEEKTELMKKVDVQREYTNMYALLMNDANFTGEKFESLNTLLNLYKDINSSKVNSEGEFDSVFRFSPTRKVLNYRENPVTRIMLERAFYDPQLKFDPTHFPGKVTAGNQETATIFLRKISAYSKWYARNMQSTGLFAPAHKEITVTVPDGVDFTKLQLQIGVGDNVSGLIKHEIILKRPPRMVKKYSFSSRTLTVTHPYGGLIYLTSHDKNPTNETATFTFDNVEKAIHFKLGETTESDWDTMKTYLAPKAELESKHFINTFARKNIAELTFAEIENIARGFDEVALNSNDFYGYDTSCSADILEFTKHSPPTCDTRKGYKHRQVFDPHISIGAGHSGYPIMVMTWRPNSTNFPQNPRKSWLLWHELGHNTVEKWLNIAGAGEVANNVMCLYQQHKFGETSKIANRMPSSGILVNKAQSYGDGGAFGRLVMFAQIPLWVEANYFVEFKAANPKYFETDGTPKSEFGFLDNSVWDIFKIMHRETRENNSTSEYRYSACAKNDNLTTSENFGTCMSSILQLDLTSFLQDWEIGTIGAGVVDGVSVYDSSDGFGTAGESAISDMNLQNPSSPIQGFTGN